MQQKAQNYVESDTSCTCVLIHTEANTKQKAIQNVLLPSLDAKI